MKKYILFLIIVFSALWVLNIPQTKAACTGSSPTWNSTVDYSSVNSCVFQAVSGDTVNVSAGNASWSRIDVNSKSITIRGAGAGNTVISGDGFRLTGNNATRITGFTFNIGGFGTALTVEASDTAGPAGWRLDHCTIVGDGNVPGFNPFYVSGYGTAGAPAKGLVDNCDITSARNVVYGDYQQGSTGNPGGSKRFSEPLDLGTANAIYVEDNIFRHFNPSDYGQIMDTRMGGKYVFRFNTVYNNYLEAHHVQSGGDRGTRSWEIYKNTMDLESGFVNWFPMSLRGGTGVVWGNAITGYWNRKNIRFDLRRLDENFTYSGLCNGSSPWDGNIGPQPGYWCRDQIGRSTDQWLWTAGNPYPPQALDPVYLWLNRDGASIWSVSVDTNGGDNLYIQNNRDYYDEVSGFNGTSGTGYGTLASRPATCTTGVGYWATNQGEWNSNQAGNDGQLYKCTATNTWTLYYTPYTYPHPLQGGSTPQTCGNNVREGTEVCDGTDLAGQTCVSRGFSGGTLACNSQCAGFVTTGCTSSQYFLPEQIVQAESGTLSGMQTGISGSDTYIYTSTDNTGSASFAFNIQNAGQYKMEARVNNKNNSGENSFYVGLDSEAAQGNDYYSYGIFPLALGFLWDNVSRWGNGQAGDPPISEFDPMTWNLSVGTHTFTFYGRESNAWLDQIILKRVTTDTTPPASPTGLQIQ